MATAVTWAQEAITCDLCENSVQQFCNSCQIGLCRDCINKHVNDLPSRSHNIVPFTDRTVELDFLQCSTHPKQKCEAHCEICDVPACIKCVANLHVGHKVLSLIDIIERKKEVIKQDTHEIEDTLMPNYKALSNRAENEISKIESHFANLGEQAGVQKAHWHSEVDRIFSNLNSQMKSLKDRHMTVLRSVQSQLSSQNCTMVQTVQQNKDILSSNNMSLINLYESKLTEFRKCPHIPDFPQPSLQTNKDENGGHSVTFGRYTAKLTHTLIGDESYLPKLLMQSKVVAVISTSLQEICRIVCLLSDRAWVSGKENTIKCVDIFGFLHYTVNMTSEKYPSDLTLNNDGELVYSDLVHRRVNIVKNGEKTETLFNTPTGWHPEGLHCSRSGDILVSVRTTYGGKHKIVRYREHKITQEIEKDERGNFLFQNGNNSVLLSQNNNKDIVACDQNADVIVVLNKRGLVRFRYNKKPPRGQKPFSPRQVVTDDVTGHIIVVDAKNSCLHILNQNGQFLRCVDDSGLENPCGLGVDSEGRLWVGLYSSGKIKVIRYLE